MNNVRPFRPRPDAPRIYQAPRIPRDESFGLDRIIALMLVVILVVAIGVGTYLSFRH
jgi:uncharacterized membrane protein